MSTDTEDAGSLLAAGASELHLAGDLATSRRWFDAAYEAAERAGDARAMAAAVLGFGGLWVHESRTVAGSTLLHSRLRQTLALLDPDSSLGLRLRIRLAAEIDYRAGGHDNVHRLLQCARRDGDLAALPLALSLTHHCVLGPDHGAKRRALAAELVEVGARTAQRTDLLMGLLWQVVDLFLGADPHAERRLAELREQLDRQDHRAVRYVVTAIETMLAIRAGRFAEAEQLAHTCAAQGSAAGDVDTPGWLGGQLVAIRWFQGRLTELLPMLTDIIHSPTLSAVDDSYWSALAVGAACAGDRRTAAGALARLCRHDLADLPRSSTWLVTMNGVVEAAHLLGDGRTAARAYELLSPFADLPMMVSLGVACFGSAHHALGVASLTTGDLDRAVEHFRLAIQQNLAVGHWPATVLSRTRHAQALALRAQPGDEIAAARARAAAVEDAAALGMPLPAVDRPGAPVATCTRQGRSWRIDWGVRSARVPHSVGMLHLAVLLANPGSDIPAEDLAAGSAALGPRPAGPSAQPVLDGTAVREYRQRLAQLDEHDGTEREWLLAELAAATGRGGRTRTFTDSRERARIAVGKTIRRALDRIARSDPAIAEHLRAHVHTGVRCCYHPPRDRRR